MSNEEIRKRYPKLITCLQYLLIGSEGEAISTIRIYLDGGTYGCEACSHAGRTVKEAIQQAITCRHCVSKKFSRFKPYEFQKKLGNVIY